MSEPTPRASRSSPAKDACSIEEIDTRYKGWVLIRVTAHDEYDSPLEGIVVARGKKRIHEYLPSIAALDVRSNETYYLHRAGVVSSRNSPSPWVSDIDERV